MTAAILIAVLLWLIPMVQHRHWCLDIRLARHLPLGDPLRLLIRRSFLVYIMGAVGIVSLSMRLIGLDQSAWASILFSGIYVLWAGCAVYFIDLAREDRVHGVR